MDKICQRDSPKSGDSLPEMWKWGMVQPAIHKVSASYEPFCYARKSSPLVALNFSIMLEWYSFYNHTETTLERLGYCDCVR